MELCVWGRRTLQALLPVSTHLTLDIEVKKVLVLHSEAKRKGGLQSIKLMRNWKINIKSMKYREGISFRAFEYSTERKGSMALKTASVLSRSKWLQNEQEIARVT